MHFFFTQDIFESRFSKIPDEPRNAVPTSENRKKKRVETAPSLSSSDSSDSESSSPSEKNSDSEDEEERAQRLASLEEQVGHLEKQHLRHHRQKERPQAI